MSYVDESLGFDHLERRKEFNMTVEEVRARHRLLVLGLWALATAIVLTALALAGVRPG